MKVCHLTYDMRIGGTEQVIVNIVKGLHPASKKNAVEPQQDEYFHEILCIEKTIGPFGEKLIRKGIKIQCLSRKNGFDYRLVLKIRNYIKSESIDILHCHQYTPWSYGALACIGTKTNVVFTEHGRFYTDYSTFKRKLINPILARLTRKITAISQAMLR